LILSHILHAFFFCGLERANIAERFEFHAPVLVFGTKSSSPFLECPIQIYLKILKKKI